MCISWARWEHELTLSRASKLMVLFFNHSAMFWQVSDIMHALFGTHKEAALPFFEQLLPDFHSLILVSGVLFNYHLCSNITTRHLNSCVWSCSFLVQRSAVKRIPREQFLLSFSVNFRRNENEKWCWSFLTVLSELIDALTAPVYKLFSRRLVGIPIKSLYIGGCHLQEPLTLKCLVLFVAFIWLTPTGEL